MLQQFDSGSRNRNNPLAAQGKARKPAKYAKIALSDSIMGASGDVDG
jgi:hypothetical protein